MGWKKMLFKSCCSCSLNIRLALDVLEIICCNVIHYAMEGTRFYLYENNNYKMGEFIWYIAVSSIGFVAQLTVLMKVVGCTCSSNHFLRLYYLVSALLLLSMSTIVTAISYADKQFDSSCNSSNMTLDVTKLCLKQVINSVNKNGPMSGSQFGFEFAMFITTALTGFLYIYSFILTFCKPKTISDDTGKDADLIPRAEKKPSWPPAEFDKIETDTDNANQGEATTKSGSCSSKSTPSPSAPPLMLHP